MSFDSSLCYNADHDQIGTTREEQHCRACGVRTLPAAGLAYAAPARIYYNQCKVFSNFKVNMACGKDQPSHLAVLSATSVIEAASILCFSALTHKLCTPISLPSQLPLASAPLFYQTFHMPIYSSGDTSPFSSKVTAKPALVLFAECHGRKHMLNGCLPAPKQEACSCSVCCI